MVKNPPANAGDTGSIPESGQSLEEGMASLPSILAWRIPGTEEPGGLVHGVREELNMTEALRVHAHILSISYLYQPRQHIQKERHYFAD